MEIAGRNRLEKKNILIISPEPWSPIFVSKHHYAVELAKRNNKVFFLNPPSAKKKIEITPSEFDNLFIVDYSVTIRGQRFLPGFLRRWIDRKIYTSFEKRSGLKFDVIWNFENSRFYDFRFATRNTLKIYHQVDLNQNFHPHLAARTADICFGVNDPIKDKLIPHNPNTFKITHGVSPKAFCKEGEAHLMNEPGRKIKATYVGNLDIPYLDLDLLRKLVEKFPQVSFRLIGSYKEQGNIFRLLSGFPNVHFAGAITSDKIKHHLCDSDILLLCYKANIYKDQLASSHKLMEYFASGKVVVATYTDEYKDKSELLLMAKENEDVPGLFQQAIENLGELNSCKHMQKRIAFAREHTYDKQLDKIQHYIDHVQD